MICIDNDGKQFVTDDLLHCPFCGGDPEILFHGNRNTKTRKVTIKCVVCRVERIDAGLRNNHEWVAKICIEQWNKRV